jgi:hypothetical protein
MAIGNINEGETLRFADGVAINTGGELRIMYIGREFYVVGEGSIRSANDEHSAQDLIRSLKD